MVRFLIRSLIILFAALIFGFTYNQLMGNGIKWQLLLPSKLYQTAETQNQITVISADSAYTLWEKRSAKFLDIREKELYELDHIPGAQHLPFSELISKDQSSIVNHSGRWVIYDEHGEMEKLQISANQLLQNSVPRVFIIFGGYLSWLDFGYPTERGDWD